MATFLIVLFTVLLLALSGFLVLIILMQKPSANASMGSALGGGAVEQAFGGNTVNILTRTTIYGIIAFFVIGFGLYLGHLRDPQVETPSKTDAALSNVTSQKAATPEQAATESPLLTEESAIPSAESVEDFSEAETLSIDEILGDE